MQERNIYAGCAETLMQAHFDSGITHVYQSHESYVRRANLPEVMRFTAGVTCRGASRLSVACAADRWRYAYRIFSRGGKKSECFIDWQRASQGSRWCTSTRPRRVSRTFRMMYSGFREAMLPRYSQ